MRTEPPQPDIAEHRVDDGTSVCTLGVPARVPIQQGGDEQ